MLHTAIVFCMQSFNFTQIILEIRTNQVDQTYQSSQNCTIWIVQSSF